MTTPSPHHTITFSNETEKKLFMSFGLLNQLSAIGGDIHTLTLIQSEASLRDAVLALTLTQRGPDGQVMKAYDANLPEFEISIDEGERLLAWVVAHLQDFFIKRLKCQLELQTKTNEVLQKG